MKKFLCAVALLMVSGLTSPAIAGDDSQGGNPRISIGFYFPGDNYGSFSMCGAGDAHGLAEVTSAVQYTDPDGNLRLRTTKVLHYPGGDVFMATEGTFITVGNERVSSGTWIFTSGDGIYVNVSGGGNYHWFRNLTTKILTGAYSGKMKLDDDEDGVPKK